MTQPQLEVERESGAAMRETEKGEINSASREDADESDRVEMLRRLNPTNPLRIVINGDIIPASSASCRSKSTPLQSRSATSLNSTKCTNTMSLFLFILHMVISIALVCFLVLKAIQGLTGSNHSISKNEIRVLHYLLPQVEAASLLSIPLALSWQKLLTKKPHLIINFILWTTFLASLSAGILLICFQNPPTDILGVCFIAFAIIEGLYACWVTPRIQFGCKVLAKSLEPVSKLADLNRPTYWMVGVVFVWISFWILAVMGAFNFYLPVLVIIGLVLSLAWTAEVMRNVVNLTVCRVVSLYYLRGMQSNTRVCFQRALMRNLGSASLGSVFVPTIEALRILTRGLNLLEGEDEVMFSCAHCCLRLMQCIFRNGNGWAFVQIAAYGKDFVQASRDTWELFEQMQMEVVVDSDITSSICFLSGVCSGSICVIVAASWTASVHQSFTATISLLTFFVGYLMTRIVMALPQACVSCYYVCYAEDPDNRLFDNTIKDHQKLFKSEDVVLSTPRVPHQLNTV